MLICNKSCSAGEIQVINFNISGLALEPRTMAANSNDTEPQPYFLTVQAVTGSGRSISASSAGVYVDTTPPRFDTIFHVDLAWSSSEPSTYQGDNSSIAVYFEVIDPESEVIPLSTTISYSSTYSATIMPGRSCCSHPQPPSPNSPSSVKSSFMLSTHIGFGLHFLLFPCTSFTIVIMLTITTNRSPQLKYTYTNGVSMLFRFICLVFIQCVKFGNIYHV